MSGPFNIDAMEKLRNDLRSREGSPVLNLYAVSERHTGGVLCIVSGNTAEDAVDECRDLGLPWTLANTTTRRIQRNVDCEEGVLTAMRMGGIPGPIRDRHRRSRDAHFRRKAKRQNGAAQHG